VIIPVIIPITVAATVLVVIVIIPVIVVVITVIVTPVVVVPVVMAVPASRCGRRGGDGLNFADNHDRAVKPGGHASHRVFPKAANRPGPIHHAVSGVPGDETVFLAHGGQQRPAEIDGPLILSAHDCRSISGDRHAGGRALATAGEANRSERQPEAVPLGNKAPLLPDGFGFTHGQHTTRGIYRNIADSIFAQPTEPLAPEIAAGGIEAGHKAVARTLGDKGGGPECGIKIDGAREAAADNQIASRINGN